MTEQRFDVERGVRTINDHLVSRGFSPRDADGSDFQRGTDRRLRFKTGTVYGEVTVTVWLYDRQMKSPIRMLSDAHVEAVKERIDQFIAQLESEPEVKTTGKTYIEKASE